MFPNREYESWAEYQRLLLHTKEAIRTISADHEDDRLHIATISSKSG
jgi:hypothetical protein